MEGGPLEILTRAELEVQFTTYFDGVVSDYPDKVWKAHESALTLTKANAPLASEMAAQSTLELIGLRDHVAAYNFSDYRRLMYEAVRWGLICYAFTGLGVNKAFKNSDVGRSVDKAMRVVGIYNHQAAELMIPTPELIKAAVNRARITGRTPPDEAQLQVNAEQAAYGFDPSVSI